MSLEINGYINDNKFDENAFQSVFFGVIEKLQILDERVRQWIVNMNLMQRQQSVASLIKAYDHFLEQIESIEVPGQPQDYVEAVMGEVKGVKSQVTGERDSLLKELNKLKKQSSNPAANTRLPDSLSLIPLDVDSL